MQNSGEDTENIAEIITDKLLVNAPLHLKKPQIAELAKLNMEQLVAFMEIESMPITSDVRERIVRKLGSEELIKRLEKRWDFASAIAEAEREGLYEAAEHITGMLDPSDDSLQD